MGTLSVRENLAFSAALRLPMSLTRTERLNKVESVISELGLSHVANTKVRVHVCVCVCVFVVCVIMSTILVRISIRCILCNLFTRPRVKLKCMYMYW